MWLLGCCVCGCLGIVVSVVKVLCQIKCWFVCVSAVCCQHESLSAEVCV